MPADRPPRRLGRLARGVLTVRGRTTIVTVLVVALASVIAALALLFTMRELLTDSVVKAAQLRVAEVSAQTAKSLADTGKVPRTLPVADPDDEFVQLLAPTGLVIAASVNVSGLPAQGGPGPPREIPGPLPEKPVVVVTGTVDALATPYGRVTVVVGESLDTVEDATQTLTFLLTVGLPPLLALVGYAAWLLIGRALAPVEAIRAEVDVISSSRLDRRVPEPPGQDEIARLARTMNGMLGRLEQSVRRQRQFTADASHELRSPLAAVRQHAEVSLAHPTRYPGSELAGTVLSEVLRMQRLVDDLLLLARADESSPDVSQVCVDLDDIVFSEAARVRTETSLRVDTRGVSAGRVRGDPDGLRRLLRNLTDNAARHARERIGLGLTERNGRTLLTVEDDGAGIPEGERDRVLERFVRLDEARARDDGGSGLGLAIVAELARAYDARLSISDARLGGARVEVDLPSAPDPD